MAYNRGAEQSPFLPHVSKAEVEPLLGRTIIAEQPCRSCGERSAIIKHHHYSPRTPSMRRLQPRRPLPLSLACVAIASSRTGMGSGSEVSPPYVPTRINNKDQSMWQMPSHLPDLRRHNIIAIDLETNDEGLRADLGSSWPWRGGYICGISVAWHGENGIQGEYVPLRHPDSENVPIEVATRWLADLIASDVRIVTQNGLYDWGWIRADLGLSMPESDRLEEIGALATMIDEDRYDYRLDSLAAWRGLPGKDVSVLTEAIKIRWLDGA